jgi:hypothetical protein
MFVTGLRLLARHEAALAAALYFTLVIGAAMPVHAQVDLEGTYNSESAVDFRARLYGPKAVDYLGIPLNDEARAAALAYDQDTVAAPGHQCLPWGPQYLVEGAFNIHIWADLDPDTSTVTAWNISGWGDWQPLKIWMGGKKRPDPNALRQHSGFTVGRWLGDTLEAMITDVKDGYLTRNGVPSSDRQTMLLWITRHDDLLSVTAIINDPDFLTEPWVQTREYIQTHNPPDSGLQYQTPCLQDNEVPELAHGKVPHYLPGKNPSEMELTKGYHIPLDAVLGGAHTMYPEYQDRMRGHYTPPGSCTRNCCGWGDFRASANPRLECKEDQSSQLSEKDKP